MRTELAQAQAFARMPLPPAMRDGKSALTRTIEYRGYRLVIQVPTDRLGRWHVLIWPPGIRPPLVRPAHTSEDHAIQDARNTVDRELDGAARPRTQLDPTPGSARHGHQHRHWHGADQSHHQGRCHHDLRCPTFAMARGGRARGAVLKPTPTVAEAAQPARRSALPDLGLAHGAGLSQSERLQGVTRDRYSHAQRIATMG